jgi:hypothetical protein
MTILLEYVYNVYQLPEFAIENASRRGIEVA